MEGKRVIVPVGMTITEILNMAPQISLVVPIAEKPKDDVVKASVKQYTQDKVEIFDIVKYTGPVDADNSDLIPGNEYRVLNITRNQYEIIDDNSPTPIRLAVWKNWAVLVKKHDPEKLNKKIDLFDTTITCDCGLFVGLVMKDGLNYKGQCNCGRNIVIAREDIGKLKNAKVQGDGLLSEPEIVYKSK